MIEKPKPDIKPNLQLIPEEDVLKQAMKLIHPLFQSRRDWEARIMAIMYEASKEVQIERRESIK